jgi:hypothetical protein
MFVAATISLLFFVLLFVIKIIRKKVNEKSNRKEEVMMQILDASKKTKSALVVIPDKSDIQLFNELVNEGLLRKNPLGDGYMLTEDHEKIWSKIPTDSIYHSKFEPDDGVLTKDLDPKTGKLVPVITEKMVLEEKEKVDEILRRKKDEIEKIRPVIEAEKRKTIDSILAMKNK